MNNVELAKLIYGFVQAADEVQCDGSCLECVLGSEAATKEGRNPCNLLTNLEFSLRRALKGVS